MHRPAFIGSSPRVWGTRSVQSAYITWSRFIPACVGNSSSGVKGQSDIAVHPRVCGELYLVATPDPSEYGSSPRVWGTPRHYDYDQKNHRFIPACVGNSTRLKTTRLSQTVHPRVCGELSPRNVLYPFLFGSSPRVWGTLYHHTTSFTQYRFIPACVGNSPSVAYRVLLQTVHPRVCGELAQFRISALICVGSSPRVWGTLCL